ncbi:MAG: hypothetical protein NTW82_13135 [Bacteroidia bacterium]|nr:hypothetical protein [Bacteroidia bacterium]
MRLVCPLFALFLLFSCNSDRSENLIGIGDRIHHDDFEYSVSDYTTTKFLTNGIDTLKAHGIYYLVNFKVENRAMRVGHKWDNFIAYLIDEKGNSYENNTDLQQFYGKTHPFGFNENYETSAGIADSTILVFDIPLNITEPYLKVRGEILMGDVFDRARFREMKVKLY